MKHDNSRNKQSSSSDEDSDGHDREKTSKESGGSEDEEAVVKKDETSSEEKSRSRSEKLKPKKKFKGVSSKKTTKVKTEPEEDSHSSQDPDDESKTSPKQSKESPTRRKKHVNKAEKKESSEEESNKSDGKKKKEKLKLHKKRTYTSSDEEEDDKKPKLDKVKSEDSDNASQKSVSDTEATKSRLKPPSIERPALKKKAPPSSRMQKEESCKKRPPTSDDDSDSDFSTSRKKQLRRKDAPSSKVKKERGQSSASDSDNEGDSDFSISKERKRYFGGKVSSKKKQKDSSSDDDKPVLKLSKSRSQSSKKISSSCKHDGIKRSKTKHSKTKAKESDSEDELDKEIRKLAKAPKLNKKSTKRKYRQLLGDREVVLRVKKLKKSDIRKWRSHIPKLDGTADTDDNHEIDTSDEEDETNDLPPKTNKDKASNDADETQSEGRKSADADETQSNSSRTSAAARKGKNPKFKEQPKKKTRKEMIEEISSGSESEMQTNDKTKNDGEARSESEDEDFISKLMCETPSSIANRSEDSQQLDVAAMNEDEKARHAIAEQLNSDSDSDSFCGDKVEKTNNEKGKHREKKDKKVVFLDSGDEESDDDDLPDSSKRKRITDRLLTVPLSDSDDEEAGTSKPKQSKKKEESESDSDSDLSDDKKKKMKKKRKRQAKSSSDDGRKDSDDDSDSKGKKKPKKKRSRIKRMSSSGSEAEKLDAESPSKSHKNIRRIIKDKNLSQEAQDAAKAEQDRRQRLKERQDKYNIMDKDTSDTSHDRRVSELVLEWDNEDPPKPVIQVNKDLVKTLKPHQVEAVRFLWDNCVESIEQLKKEEGAGCILAHSMGLGKTLSVITFTHTLMANYDATGIRTCLIICPLNTVLNWQNEFTKWLDEDEQFSMWELSSVKDTYLRCDCLKDWQNQGGIMIIGYEMYRNLTLHKNVRKPKLRKIVTETLVSPGPDVVVCDEGHLLKNAASALSTAVNNIRTRRRVVLTGTPLQNNLIEYHCMVDFVKPKLLGTKKEFCNRFVNPITNGQSKDATAFDVKLMKKRAHILHETLAGCVQRRDYGILKKFLGPKYEYVITIRLSDLQVQLYEKYLQEVGRDGCEDDKVKSAALFVDYKNLMQVWNHPYLLKLGDLRDEEKRVLNEDSDFVTDETDSDMASFIASDSSEEEKSPSSASDETGSSSSSKKKKKKEKNSKEKSGKEKNGKGKQSRKTRRSRRLNQDEGGDDDDDTEDEPEVKVGTKWWSPFITEETQFDINLGGKILLLAEILRMCEAIGDKVLVFSQSLLSLNCIEDFLDHWDSQTNVDADKQIAGTLGWAKDIDYFRMDGSTSAANRKVWADIFNDPENHRARLFLISTKAGSLGTNLVGGNRVIIFDASWNPSHDMQSMFRVYRFGQTKPVYIYRFLAQGTMEQKIYDRQVTKQSLAHRVIDEQQIERHYTKADLAELYAFKPDRYDPDTEQDIPVLPKDLLLAELLSEKRRWIMKYHEHDSLLEQQEGEGLTEEERKAAWQEYEDEKKHGVRRIASAGNMFGRQQFGQQQHMMLPQVQWHQQQQLYQKCIEAEPDQMTPGFLREMARQLKTANPNLTDEQIQAYVMVYKKEQDTLRYQRIRERYQKMFSQMQRLFIMQQNQAQNQASASLALQGMAQQQPSTSRQAPEGSSRLEDLLTKPSR